MKSIMIGLSVITIQCTIQIANQIMEELNQFGFAITLPSETMLTVSKNVFLCLFILVTIIYSKVLQQMQVSDNGL